jgi:hypothetical protein
MNACKAVSQQYLGMLLKEFCRVVTIDPEELRPKPHDFPRELLICVIITGLFSSLLLLWRSCPWIRSQLYVRRLKQLALKISRLMEEKNVCYLKNLAFFKNRMMA